MGYCKKLSETQVSLPLAERMGARYEAKNWIRDLMGWERWPTVAKTAIEGLLVSVVVAGIAVFLPWDKLGIFSSSTEPAEVATRGAMDGQSPETKENSFVAAVEEKNKEVKDKLRDLERQAESSSPVSEPIDPKAIEAEKQKQQEIAERFESKKKDVVKPQKSGNAFLYRGVMRASDLDVITPQLVTKIKSLGGKKGGKVEIGWRKPNASYFHFTMPEQHYQEVLIFLVATEP